MTGKNLKLIDVDQAWDPPKKWFQVQLNYEGSVPEDEVSEAAFALFLSWLCISAYRKNLDKETFIELVSEIFDGMEGDGDA
jgi:hypothetical protein